MDGVWSTGTNHVSPRYLINTFLFYLTTSASCLLFILITLLVRYLTKTLIGDGGVGRVRLPHSAGWQKAPNHMPNSITEEHPRPGLALIESRSKH